MNPKEAVSTLISELNGRIPPPVHTAGIQEQRPVPAVLLNGVSIEPVQHHNSNYAGSEFDPDTQHETSQIFRHYYSIRFDLLIRDDSEVGAYEILTQLQAALSALSRRPWETFHPDVNDMRLLGSGEVSYTFNEPTETELNQAVTLDSFYETTDSDLDVIESFLETLEVT
jgi:hypothetical protein